jgi:hypothetical protein
MIHLGMIDQGFIVYALMLETVCSSEMLARPPTRLQCQKPEDYNLYIHHCENLKTYPMYFFLSVTEFCVIL